MENSNTMIPARTALGTVPIAEVDDSETALRQKSPLWKRLIPILTAAGILTYLFWHIDIQQCFVALLQADLSIYVPWLVVFILVTFLMDTQNLSALLRHFNYPILFRDALSIRGVTYLLSTIDYSLGLGALIYYLKHDQGIPVMRSTGLMAFFNTITHLTLVCMSLVGLLLLSPTNSLLQKFLYLCCALLIFNLVFIGLLKGLPSHGWLQKFKELNLIKVFHEAPWKSYGILIFWRGVYYSLFIAFFYFAVQAFHMRIPLMPLIAYVPIILLIISMPITPCGFGTSQAAMIYLFQDYGTSVNIMAFGLTYSTSIIVFRSLIGLCFTNSMTGLVSNKTVPTAMEAHHTSPSQKGGCMQQSYESILNHEYEGASDCLPVNCQDYLIMQSKGFNYYLVDLRYADWESIRDIISACEAVENECWTAQENFFDYLKKCDILSYVEKDGQVIAFDAVTLLVSGKQCIYSNDETMVLKAFRGKDIARKLVIATAEWFYTKTDDFKNIKNLVFLSISANPRVVNGYFKNAYTRILFDCSFKPSPQLIALKEEYCRKHRISLVHKDYPFCLKNLFPGSNNFDCKDPRFQFSRAVKANLPADFDHMARGDAFAFMVKVKMAAARSVIFFLMALDFGKDYFSRRGIGLFSPPAPAKSAHTETWQTHPQGVAPIGIVPKPDQAQQGISVSLGQQ